MRTSTIFLLLAFFLPLSLFSQQEGEVFVDQDMKTPSFYPKRFWNYLLEFIGFA